MPSSLRLLPYGVEESCFRFRFAVANSQKWCDAELTWDPRATDVLRGRRLVRVDEADARDAGLPEDLVRPQPALAMWSQIETGKSGNIGNLRIAKGLVLDIEGDAPDGFA